MLNKNQLYKLKLNLHALLKIKTVTIVNMMKLVIVDDERHKKKIEKDFIPNKSEQRYDF
jgi:hypothetical protein